jgi:acyl-CoA dehydrogenase
VRSARLVDGASEVHKMAFSHTLMDAGDEFWRWG